MGGDIYSRLGIEPVINAVGTMTMLGGSRMAPEVLKAMAEASRSFVDLAAFHDRAGSYIADLLGVEAACITCGAAAGMTIATAACMNRGDGDAILRLPEAAGMADTCLMFASHRTLFAQSIRTAGARIVELGRDGTVCEDDVAAAIDERTALFFYIAESGERPRSLSVSQVSSVLQEKNIPLVVDAAAELPPGDRYLEYLRNGADLVILSGGKEIRGPQSSGLILGRSDLIQSCKANSCPRHSIGRGMKVDKETIAGIVRAVELFVERDYSAIMQRWGMWVDAVVSVCSSHPSLVARKGFPREPGVQPVIIPRAYIRHKEKPASRFAEELRSCETPLWVWVDGEEIVVNPQCLEQEEVPKVIAILTSCSAACPR